MDRELEGLFNLSITTELLDGKHLEALVYLLNNPEATVSDFYRLMKDICINNKRLDYKSSWRTFDKLYKLKERKRHFIGIRIFCTGNVIMGLAPIITSTKVRGSSIIQKLQTIVWSTTLKVLTGYLSASSTIKLQIIDI